MPVGLEDHFTRLAVTQRSRDRALRRWRTPGDLAAEMDPQGLIIGRQTPALRLIDDAVVEAYNTPDSRLLISMPPQEGKSTRTTLVTPLWMLTQDPELRVAITAYGQDLADRFSKDIQGWIKTYDGTEGTLDLGLRLARGAAGLRQWRLDGHRGGLKVVGIEGRLTGHPVDALFIDDPIPDMLHADSVSWRERVWSFWQAVASTRLAPGAPVIVIMTRWHEDDLGGRLLAAEDAHRWRVLNIPALADHDPEKGQSDALGRQPGEWLESARGRTPADWERIRVQAGSRVFAALYQGRPSPEVGNVWQRGWWRRYDRMMWSQHPDEPDAYWVDGMDSIVQSWDMAFRDTKGSDYVVGQVWAKKGPNVYLLDQVHKRLAFTDTLTAFRALTRRWPQATAKYVEAKANGDAVIDTLRHEIGGIVPVDPGRDSKYARANAVAPFIEAGNVLLPDPAVALFNTDDLIEEAAGFPNSAHDDQVDATSQALSKLLLQRGNTAAFLEWMKAKKAAQDEAEA